MAPIPLIPTLSTQNKLNSGKQLCINSLYFANKQDYACSFSPMEMGQTLETIPNNCTLIMDQHCNDPSMAFGGKKKKKVAFTCCYSPYIVKEPLQQDDARQRPILGYIVPMLSIYTLLEEKMLYRHQQCVCEPVFT